MNKTEPTVAYQFVHDIIESCKTDFHFESAGILIGLFKKKYPDESKMKGQLVDLLYDKIQETFPKPKTVGEA